MGRWPMADGSKLGVVEVGMLLLFALIVGSFPLSPPFPLRFVLSLPNPCPFV
jgi:hypothetical protein